LGSFGGVAYSAQDIFISGVQCELGTFATSYMPTTNAPATRLLDAPTFPAIAGITSSGCVSARFVPEWNGNAPATGGILAGGTNGKYLFVSTGDAGVSDGYGTLGVGVAFDAGVAVSLASNWTGSAMNLYNDTTATSVTGFFDGGMGNSTLEVGYTSWGATGIGGWIGRVKIDPSPTRCR
jgi:hypothetical protein